MYTDDVSFKKIYCENSWKLIMRQVINQVFDNLAQGIIIRLKVRDIPIEKEWHLKSLHAVIISQFDWMPLIKIQQITRPLLTIQKKLADSENICVWTYEKGPQVIWLDLKSNTNILDKYISLTYFPLCWKKYIKWYQLLLPFLFDD